MSQLKYLKNTEHYKHYFSSHLFLSRASIYHVVFIIMATEQVAVSDERDSDVVPVGNDEQEKSWYICHVHGKDLMPLSCTDCESTVCLDCIVTTHVGHKMCKISDGIEEKMEELNNAIQKKGSSCFDLNKVQENLQKRQVDLHLQKEQMVKLVTDREDEIVRKVKNVCQQTIKKITNLATEIESPLISDEEMLKSLMACDLFQKDSDKDCMKILHFYNRLKKLDCKYVTQNRDNMPFNFVTRDLSSEKIIELVGSLLINEELSSDFKVSDRAINEDGQSHQYRKKCIEENVRAMVLVSPERGFLLSKDDLYQQTGSDVKSLLESVKLITYVPESDEILYVLRDQSMKIYRMSASGDGKQTHLSTMNCTEILAIGHDKTNYLTILCSFPNGYGCKSLKVCLMDSIGCLTKPVIDCDEDHYNLKQTKIFKSSIGVCFDHVISVKYGPIFDTGFSYSGIIGNEPKTTFSPTDLCTDLDGNFLVIDSYDNTVHLLDSKGKFLKIIMFEEDGLNGINCIEMDSSGWLHLGCKDGYVQYANVQYYKKTTREERCMKRRSQQK